MTNRPHTQSHLSLGAGRRERGTAILEFMLAFPALIAIVGLAFALGWALSTKQHGIVAARYAATAAEFGAAPDGARISNAVSKGREPWTSGSVDPAFNASSVAHSCIDNVGGLASGAIADAMNAIIDTIGAGGIRGTESVSQPEVSRFRFTNPPPARSHYFMTAGTWTCREGADYSHFVKEKADHYLSSVPLVGGLLSAIADKGIPDNLSCCDDW